MPQLSVIIPVYNRGDLIQFTLESVRRASAGLAVEVIVVDDGSDPPTAATLARLGFTPSVLVRQANQGLLFARLAGLARATGRFVLFLDSDDLVSPEKCRRQIAAMDEVGADISYSDSARCEINGEFDSLLYSPDPPARNTSDCAEFCLLVQPPPHSPIFRTAWLRDVVSTAFIPPSPLYNSVAEIWFYHNAAPRLGRVVRVPGPHTIVGSHPGARLTNHWEKLAMGSLAVMEAFARLCPVAVETEQARRLVGEVAFASWRKLPRGFSPEFNDRLLGIWRRLGDQGRSRLGGGKFQLLARLLGPIHAANLFRLVQNGSYDGCRTLTDADVRKLLSALPPP